MLLVGNTGVSDAAAGGAFTYTCEVELCPAGAYFSGSPSPSSSPSSFACTACPSGTFGPAPSRANASVACSGVCAAGPGSYCGTGMTAATGLPCPPGRFGSSLGLTGAGCTGPCSAGYACPEGSTNSTTIVCGPGSYSPSGSAQCTPCAPGAFGDAPASAVCSGLCLAGFSCPSGSWNGTAVACAPGRYSLGGSATCVQCPAGVYGATMALASAACSGSCAAGYVCPSGSTTPTATLCPAGQYSLAGASVCTACPSTSPYSLPASTSMAACTSVCPDGTWTLWLDASGVEGAHSCIKRFTTDRKSVV